MVRSSRSGGTRGKRGGSTPKWCECGHPKAKHKKKKFHCLEKDCDCKYYDKKQLEGG